jgi:signal transduction histidine kinase
MRHGERDGSAEVPAARAGHWLSLTQAYGVAVAAAAACVVVARLAPPLDAQWELVFLLHFAPVVVGAWYGGLGPGLLAALLVAGATAYDGPPATGSIPRAGAARMGQLALYMAEGALLAYLTDRTRRAADEGRRNRTAQEANRLQDDFLALLSHELRAPMSTILGWARLLRREPVDRETSVKAFDTIERSVRAQTALLDDLLDFSHIRSGRLRLEVQTVELAPLITAAVEPVRAAASTKAIGLDVALDPRTAPIDGDPTRLMQIVGTLASHAVAVTPTGGSVRVSLEGRGPVAEIKVSDSGPGIPPDRLPQVFAPVRPMEGPIGLHHRNLGLGLALARHLTELHGGTIRVESPGIGCGATFTLRFPARAVVKALPGRPRAEEDPAIGALPPDSPGPSTSSRP